MIEPITPSGRDVSYRSSRSWQPTDSSQSANFRPVLQTRGVVRGREPRTRRQTRAARRLRDGGSGRPVAFVGPAILFPSRFLRDSFDFVLVPRARSRSSYARLVRLRVLSPAAFAALLAAPRKNVIRSRFPRDEGRARVRTRVRGRNKTKKLRAGGIPEAGAPHPALLSTLSPLLSAQPPPPACQAC